MVKSKTQFPKIQLTFPRLLYYCILPDIYFLNEVFIGGGQIAG